MSFQGSSQRLLMSLGLFIGFLVCGTLLAWPSLHYPMVWDDLHLIRHFSAPEILSSFYGPWDPDRLETPGLRPLSILFNHVRYIAFGDSMPAQRMFLLVLFALCLTSVCRIAELFGTPRHVAIVACLLCLCARYSVNHYVWLTDGNHILQGLAFTLTLQSLIRTLRQPNSIITILSISAYACGLFIREDFLAAWPALVLLGFLYQRIAAHGTGENLLFPRTMFIFTAGTGLLTLIFFAYRSHVLPEAPALKTNIEGLAVHAYLAFQFLGVTHFDFFSHLFIIAWTVMQVAVLCMLLRLRNNIDWRMPLACLVCVILTSTPGMVLMRPNLLFFPTIFAAVAIASALWQCSRPSKLAAHLSIGCALFAIIGGAYMSRITAECFAPNSTATLGRNASMLFEHKVQIPQQRRTQVEAALLAAGIRSASTWKEDLARLRQGNSPNQAAFNPRLCAPGEP